MSLAVGTRIGHYEIVGPLPAEVMLLPFDEAPEELTALASWPRALTSSTG